jgi:hypothetical protein
VAGGHGPVGTDAGPVDNRWFGEGAGRDRGTDAADAGAVGTDAGPDGTDAGRVEPARGMAGVNLPRRVPGSRRGNGSRGAARHIRLAVEVHMFPLSEG